MKTGFKELDNIIKLNKNELIVIASRPAMGKSTFIQNIISNVSIKENKSVLFYSLDANKESIIKKFIISNSMVEYKKLNLCGSSKEKTELLEEDKDRIAYSTNLLKNAKIYIDDTPNISIMDICLRCKKMKLEKDIDLVVIDYLQLISYDKSKLLSRAEEMSEILRELKVLAKTLDIPVIITSQLSSKCDRRENKRPMMSDFSDSKYGVYTYSDKVLFLYRDSYYNKENKSNITEIIIAKNNTDEVCITKLAWIPEYCMFGNTIVN